MSENPADLLVLLSHALASLLFVALALWCWRAPEWRVPFRWTLVAALAATALWSLAVAGVGSRDNTTVVLEIVRNVAWLNVVWRTLSRQGSAGTRRAATLSHATVALVFVVGGMAVVVGRSTLADPAFHAAVVLRLLASVGALVLVQNAYVAARNVKERVIALAVAAMWLIDVNMLTLLWATYTVPAAMLVTRGAAMVGIAGTLAATLHRDRDAPVHLSRTVAVQSLSLLAMLSYLAIFAGVTEMLATVGGRHARMLQTAFVFGSTAAALAVLSTPKLRAWLRVKAAKHLFRHRFDYRAEWMRFASALEVADDTTPLGERIVRAIARPLDAPGGVLLAGEADSLSVDTIWRFDTSSLPSRTDAAALVAHLAETGRIIELDKVRADTAPPLDSAAVPAWMLRCADAWAVIPLPHRDGLAGIILLARPPIERTLDWEDFDLLKVAGRQAASHLAEAQAQARLAEGERFDEFNRRFAFILHDIKNLVSQISLVARNAERHADNPAFRADMVATLNESATRMSDLVARLSHSHAPRPEGQRPTVPLAIARAIAAERRLSHPIEVVGDESIVARLDPDAVEKILRHLVQNAVEASPSDAPVTIAVATRDGRIVIDVTDRGHGMSAAFVRDRLFKPFVSTKPTGFGIGAYEARMLALAMGGEIDVESHEGKGSRFRLILPAPDTALERAA